MAIFRMHTGIDGKSHIETLDLGLHPELASVQSVISIQFREAPLGRFADWHHAPQRQCLIQLSGEVEVGLSSGRTVRYKPGDARLAEDLTGEGHTTRVVGDQPSITAVIPLAG